MGLIESKIRRAVSANGNLGIDFAAVKTPDVPQLGDSQEDYRIATSPQTRQLLGIKMPRLYRADKAPNRLVGSTVDIFVETAVTALGGEEVRDVDDANIIIFTSEYGDDRYSMLWHRNQYKRGIQGVAFTSVSSVPDGSDLTVFGRQYLGNVFSPYGAILIGDENSSIPRAAHGVSMEIGVAGKVDFEAQNADQAHLELASRLNYLAGSELVVSHVFEVVSERAFQDLWRRAGQDGGSAKALMEACKRLNEDGLLPHVSLDSLDLNLDWKKRRAIKEFLERSGLSEGQARTPQDIYRSKWITASGANKGELRRDQVILISRLNEARNGVVVLHPQGERQEKPSVESFDNLLFSYSWAGIVSGELQTSDTTEFVQFLDNNDRFNRATDPAVPADPYTVIHIHKWPTNWDSDKIVMVDMSPRLIPNQAFQSSCGTRALALETRQALAEGMLADQVREKMVDGRGDLRTIGAYMANHGVTFLVPNRPVQAEQSLVKEMQRTDNGKLVFASGILRR